MSSTLRHTLKSYKENLAWLEQRALLEPRNGALEDEIKQLKDIIANLGELTK